MDLSAYRDLWKTRGVMALLAAALIARLPVMATMVPLAFLAKDAAGNFGWAGVVAGAYSVGTAIASVVWSRMADRKGARKVVIGTGMAWGASMAVVALLPYSWYRLLPVAAAIAGVCVAPVTSALRANWPRIVHGSRLRAVYSLDATAQELLFVIGPMSGAVIVSFASPRAGLLACAVTAAASIWWFGLSQQSGSHHDESSGPRPTARELLFHPHRAPLLIAWACLVMGFAAMSLGMVAVADQHGNRLIAGVLEMVAAVGSVSGGVINGALPGRRHSYVWRRMLALAVLVAGCVFVTSSVVALAVMMFAGRLPDRAHDRRGVRADRRADAAVRAHRDLRLGAERRHGRLGGRVRRGRRGGRGVRRPLRVGPGGGSRRTGDPVPAPRPAPPAVGHQRRRRYCGRGVADAVVRLEYAAVARTHRDQPELPAVQQRTAAGGDRMDQQRHLVDQAPPEQRADQREAADHVQVLARYGLQRGQDPAGLALQHLGPRAGDHGSGADHEVPGVLQYAERTGVPLERPAAEQHGPGRGHQLSERGARQPLLGPLHDAVLGHAQPGHDVPHPPLLWVTLYQPRCR
ncbi:MFS family permease [Kribbella aluminosa]|uniref:MFS family permease n=1 Tax=Kribbella aluminosa TaxID=416017 RepID=A0ABS4URK0_9ACTN|nr:MFS family permease [Kribbella aluminosa]